MFVYGNNIVLFVTKLLPTWLWGILGYKRDCDEQYCTGN